MIILAFYNGENSQVHKRHETYNFSFLFFLSPS